MSIETEYRWAGRLGWFSALMLAIIGPHAFAYWPPLLNYVIGLYGGISLAVMLGWRLPGHVQPTMK